MTRPNRGHDEDHDPRAIAEAIEGLSIADLHRLGQAARLRFSILGPCAAGKDHMDLLQEAITRTLSGERHWRKGVDFRRHLDATMQSICSSWRKHLTRSVAAGAAEVREGDLRDPDSGAGSVLEKAQTASPDPQRAAIAREELTRIREEFDGDVEVSAVIAGFELGLTGPEIRKRAGLTEQQLAAAVRRMRYALLRQREPERAH